MLIKEEKLILNEDGFLFGDSCNKVVEVLGENRVNVANWEEIVITKDFEFCGYKFYGRLLFNEEGLYAFMMEPRFKADDTMLLALQSRMDEIIVESKKDDIEYEIKYEIYPRSFGDFCVTLLRRGFEWPM